MELSSRLLLLLEVIESGSFTKAADLRNVDRSVISKQIGKLEDELDVRLLNRTTRSLSLTTAGAEMVKQAISLREMLSETSRIAQNYHSEPRGTLRISSSTFFGRQYVQKAVEVFQRRYHEIHVELRLEDRVVDMVSEGFDIGFRIGEPKESSLVARKIARNRLLIVASPDFLKRHKEPLTIEALEQLPAAVYCAPGVLLDKIKYFVVDGEAAHIQLDIAYKVNDVEMMVMAALSGNMLAVVTAQTIEDEVLEGKLVPIMTDVNLADFGTFYAVYPHREPAIKTSLFIETLREIIGADIPVWESRIPGFDNMYGYQP